MKKCINCGNYRVYYIKAFCKFQREGHGICLKRKKKVHDNNSCKKWASDTVIKALRKHICHDIIDGLGYDLSQIAQILNEESEENPTLS